MAIIKTEKYFKTIYNDNSIGLFSSNNQKACLLYGKMVAKKSGRIIEITKEEFEKIENEIK